MKRRVLFLAWLTMLPVVCLADGPMRLGGVVLLQPESEIQPRVRSVEALASYIKRVEASAANFFASQSPVRPSSGYIVVAVKPLQQSNLWFDFKPELPAQVKTDLNKQLRGVLPMRVEHGPVVFALQVGIDGATPPGGSSAMPQEWAAEAARAGRPIEASEMVLRLWQP